MSLFAYVRNQGDVWNYTLNHLERHVSLISSQDSSAPEAPHALFTTQMGLAVAVPGLIIGGILDRREHRCREELEQIKDMLCGGASPTE